MLKLYPGAQQFVGLQAHIRGEKGVEDEWGRALDQCREQLVLPQLDTVELSTTVGVVTHKTWRCLGQTVLMLYEDLETRRGSLVSSQIRLDCTGPRSAKRRKFGPQSLLLVDADVYVSIEMLPVATQSQQASEIVPAEAEEPAHDSGSTQRVEETAAPAAPAQTAEEQAQERRSSRKSSRLESKRELKQVDTQPVEEPEVEEDVEQVSMSEPRCWLTVCASVAH